MAKENLKVMEETFSLGVNKPQIVNDSSKLKNFFYLISF